MNPLEFAIQMENDGEQFYRKQAGIYKDTVLAVIFLKLAAAEQKHAELIRGHLAGFTDVMPENEPLSSLTNIFSDMADFRRQARNLPDQLDVYRLAVGVEQRSVDLYTELLRGAAAASADEVMLSFLLKQETDHLALFDELAEFLRTAGEWVEAAEFGTRKDY
jgi:rubrerythrin